MRTRIVLCVSLVLCLAGGLHAATTQWAPLPSNNLWSDPLNWSAGLPTSGDKAQFNQEAECIVDFDGAVANQIDLAGGPIKIVDGGVLTHYSWFIPGYGAGDVGELAGRVEVYDGGVLNSMQRLFLGREGEGHLTVYEGGTVNILGQNLHVAQTATGTGVLTMEGGTINILEGSDAHGLQHTGNASVDFRGGTINLRNTTQNQDYLASAIADGIIKAYGGVGEVVVETDEELDRLEVRGVHPLKPSPSDDSLSTPGAVELSWTLPDPCVPGQPVPVDVYFTNDLTALQQFTDPAAMQVVNKQNVTSVAVQTQPKTRYYWAVDTYVDSTAEFPVIGPIFSFFADNMPPEVDAGNDVVTWLVDGVRTGNLDATVTDADAYTVQWTVVSEPNEGTAVIETATAEDTSVTLTALGEYVLQLEAFDGEYTGSDTVTINVYSDSCQAAQSLPDYVPLVGDLNGDCKVDDADMALLQENWLQENSLTEEWFKID
jgi:hypothetical protein